MWLLVAVGLLLAGVGWALDRGALETLGTIGALTGVAMVLVEHWPTR
jgi:hypothetical protein